MNSLQLISKIKSKAEDINQNISELLNPSEALQSIEKEILKKQCLDLYELLLKLKSESDQNAEKTFSKIPVFNEPQKEPDPFPGHLPLDLITEHSPESFISENSFVVSESFKEVLDWGSNNLETLDTLEQKTEFFAIDIEKNDQVMEEKHEAKPEYTEPVAEFMVDKIVENKRIQYTVLPPVEGPKAVPLNAIVVGKEISYNEKFAQKIQPDPIPFVHKTIEAPIANIKAAINLNKKIAFVNDLFNENVVEYAKAVDRLNNAADRDEGLRIFNELKHLYQWQNDHELVHELEQMIKRRHH